MCIYQWNNFIWSKPDVVFYDIIFDFYDRVLSINIVQIFLGILFMNLSCLYNSCNWFVLMCFLISLIQENYVNLCEMLTQESHPIDPNKVYYQVVGGRNQKNIVYEFGSSHNFFYAPGNSSNAVSIYCSSQYNT